MLDNIENLSIDELKAAYKAAQLEKTKATEVEKSIKEEILFRNRGALSEELAKKDEPFGSVRVGNVKFTIVKKVEWDQSALAVLYAEIGDTAHEYMDVAYKVKEAAFKNWPSSIQDAFLPARTVKPGSTSIEFIEE